MGKGILALWATPRSISTAFERVFIERGDHEVLHEPFSASFYFSRSRRSQRYGDVQPKPEHDFEWIALSIETQSAARRVFIKDLAYHIRGHFDASVFEQMTHTFLIRDPKFALPSLHRMLPDFTLEETGYEGQYLWFREIVRRHPGAIPIVIDAEDLCRDPSGTLQAYTQAVGISFMPNSLRWEPKPVEQWAVWKEWHVDAENSTHIHQSRPVREMPAGLEDAYAHCAYFYSRMREHRLLVPVEPAAGERAEPTAGSEWGERKEREQGGAY